MNLFQFESGLSYYFKSSDLSKKYLFVSFIFIIFVKDKNKIKKNKNMKRIYNFTEEETQQIIDDYVNNYLSYKDIMKKYDIHSNSKVAKILKGHVRDSSERAKIAHKRYPDSFKMSEDSKNKIRTARLKFMQEHPEKTAWRKGNKSYPEQQFEIFLKEYEYSEKYLIEREFSMFPYFIDFAFPDLKIAIEIDGSQHLKDDRKQKDLKKDEFLQSLGWKVIRIAENIVKTDWNIIKETLDKFIDLKTETTFERVGIVREKKSEYTKKSRNEQGLTDKQLKYYQNANKRTDLDLPDKNTLLKQITENSFEEVGRIYNVTGNAIKKWCKRLGLPSTKYELGQRQKDKISDKNCEQCGKLYHPKTRDSKFCCKECQSKYQFEHSKIGKIPKDVILKYIDDKVSITKASKELGITRTSMYRLCKHYQIQYKIN